jgi:hypothetical protein
MTKSQLVTLEKPDIGELTKEYSRIFENSGMGTRVKAADDVRFCRWDGQSEDGRKWQKNQPEGRMVFPWDGAADTRPHSVDEVINEVVDLLVAAYDRARLKVHGVEAGDMKGAGMAKKLMDYMIRNRLASDLVHEVELHGQYLSHYGWSALHITWEQAFQMKPLQLTMRQIEEQSAQAEPGSVMYLLPTMISDPDQEDAVLEVAQELYPGTPVKKLRRAIRELRTEGVAEIPVAYVCKNQPCVTALKPYDEIMFPPETTDIQRARVIFRREFMTEVEVRAMGSDPDQPWDEEWIEEAVKTSGKSSVWASGNLSTTGNYSLFENVDREDDLIEVVFAYTRQVNEDGIPGVYFTVFSPHISSAPDGRHLWAHHGLLNYAHGKYPFVVVRREYIRRKIMESRGIPEVASTWQLEEKSQRDSLLDRTSFDTLPPLRVPKRMGQQYEIGPAVQIPELRPGEVDFLNPPKAPVTSFELVEMLEKRKDNYFCRNSEHVAPIKTQMRQSRLVKSWLAGWTEAFSQAFSLCQQFLPDEEVARIVGEEASFSKSEMDLARQYDFILEFDPRDMDPEFMSAKLQAVANFVKPLDAAGVIDSVKLVSMGLRAIDPTLERELVSDQQQATQKMYREVQSDVVYMMAGVEPIYSENDPAAGMRLQFLNEIVTRNPMAQQQLQENELFRQLMDNYVKNLNQSVMQQQNVTIGRTGVKQVT